MQDKYWIVTVMPEPAMGGDPSKTIVRLLAWTANNAEPPFGFIVSGVMALKLAEKEMAGGITQKVQRAWPDDALRARVATPPDWSLQGLKLWILENE